MKRTGLISLLVVGLLLTAQPAAAQNTSWSGVINEATRDAIYRYFQGDKYDDGESHKSGKKNKNKGKNKNGGNLPPGLAKRDTLPPGLQKQLLENGTLPPGLAKRGLPNDLLSHIKVPKGEEFFIVDNDVVLMEQATGIVIDVLAGVFNN